MHYYIQKGWKADEFLTLSTADKVFYKASMEIAIEERNAFLGGGKK